jgi:hypothetical protein
VPDKYPTQAASTHFNVYYVAQSCFRPVNRPSGPDFGRTATGKAPKSALWLAFGRPEGRYRCFPGSSPATIRPGKPIYRLEALLRNIEYFAVAVFCCMLGPFLESCCEGHRSWLDFTTRNPVSCTHKRELCRREPTDKSPNWLVLGVKAASCLREVIRIGGGLRPPPFPIGFPEAGSRCDFKNRFIWASIFQKSDMF